MESTFPKPKYRPGIGLAFVFGLIVSVMLVVIFIQGWYPPAHKLIDPDCYMWLARAERIHETGDWRAASSLDGMFDEPVLHWGRPFDWLLGGPAWLASRFVDFHTALFWWGVVVSPLLMVATLVVLAVGWRRYLNREEFAPALLLFLTSPGILLTFAAGRPDHHSLNLFLLAGIFVAIQIMLETEAPRKWIWAAVAGVISAVALWVSVEAMLAVVIVNGVLGVLWLKRGETIAVLGLIYSGALALAAGGLILSPLTLSPWQGKVPLDCLSSAHGVVLWIIGMGWIVLVGSQRFGWMQSAGNRVLFSVGVVIVLLILVWAIVPGYFRGPYGLVLPEVRRIWMDNVVEEVPLWRYPGSPLGMVMIFLAPALLSGLYGIYRWQRDNVERDSIWLLWGVASVVFALASLQHQSRWSEHAALVSIGLWTALLGENISTRWPMRLFWWVVLGSVFSLTGALVMVIPLVEDSPTPSPEVEEVVTALPPVTKGQGALPVEGLSQWMVKSLPDISSQRVLNFINIGSELLYRTRCRVVAVPYHRDGTGILAAYHAMTARTNDEALRVIRKSGATYLLMSPTLTEERAYYEQAGTDTLYRRLVLGNHPAWLEPVALPWELAEDFKLYRVKPPVRK